MYASVSESIYAWDLSSPDTFKKVEYNQGAYIYGINYYFEPGNKILNKKDTNSLLISFESSAKIFSLDGTKLKEIDSSFTKDWNFEE
jgi:hypothetical protein